MIWTDAADLPLIGAVADAVVADAVANALKFDGTYSTLAPSLFDASSLSVSARRKAYDDLSAIEGSSGATGISLSIGSFRGCPSNIPDLRIAWGGALCQELVHRRQRARDAVSFDMSAALQKDWHANRELLPPPREWLANYLGTVNEFEAHAEQIAYEVWTRAMLGGASPPTSVALSTLTASEPLRRLRLRLLPGGTPDPLVVDWFGRLEFKVNEALASW